MDNLTRRLFTRPTRSRRVACALLCSFVLNHVARAQSPPDVWRTFAKALDVGTDVDVRLDNGQRFRATLVAAEESRLLLRPRTRIPVAVQPVAYDTISSLERHRSTHSSARAAAIGAAGGAGGVLLVVWLLIAASD